MYKFNLQQGQTGNILFWENENQTNPYSSNMLQQIKGNDFDIPITSIPSPFARMQMFDTAFDFVSRATNKNEFDGSTLYHKLVSDCLDVFEILFRIDQLNLTNRIKIVQWTPNDLLNSTDDKFNIFAQTIQLYVDKYNQGTPDNAFNSIYIILIDDIPIAGTSPLTGFFTTANDISVRINYKQIRDFFFGEPMPIHKRDEDFQKFINLFMLASQGNLINRFSAFNSYLITGRQYSSINLQAFFNNINDPNNLAGFNDYENITYNNNPLYLLPNVYYKKLKVQPQLWSNVILQSDYLAITSKNIPKKPIIINKGINNTHWNYLGSPFPTNLNINSSKEIDERNVPGTPNNIICPFLTIDDVLSEYLVELDYPVNCAKFFTGLDSEKGFLLPVKKEYFKFYTLADLKANLTIEQLQGDTYLVKLKMPVQAENKRGVIVFERNYNRYSNVLNKAENNGAIIKLPLFMGFYPFFKIGDRDVNGDFIFNPQTSIYNDFYKSFVYYDDNQFDVDCSFFKYSKSDSDLKIIPVNENRSINKARTNKNEGIGYITEYYELSNDLSTEKINRDITYDFINFRINHNGLGLIFDALIIPQMPIIKLNNIHSYVAFDIGTTNSYVALATNINNPYSLSTGGSPNAGFESQMVLYNKPFAEGNEFGFSGKDLYDFNSRVGVNFISPLLNEFMPSFVGKKYDYKIPLKTVICWDSYANIVNAQDLSLLTNINIPFAYGIKSKRQPLDNTKTNLKWNVSDNANLAARNQLEFFIKELALLARNNLLLNGINPLLSKIIWFKPLSMGNAVARSFSSIWDSISMNLFTKNFIENPNCQLISESAAPFFKLQPDNLGNYFVNIDIGGGTSDIVVFDRINVLAATSFRFAGNSMFGNGLDYRRPGKENGIARKYTNIMSEKFIMQGRSEAKLILENLSASDDVKSEDMINYFFNFADFFETIKNDSDFKILFLLHNSALMYHTAQLMKIKEYDIPKYIGLSGNGSGIFKITNGSPNLNSPGGIGELSTRIFEKVFNKKSTRNIEIIVSQNPKEATAKGGIIGINKLTNDNAQNYFVLYGNDSSGILYNDARNEDYRNLITNDPLIDSTVKNVEDFFTLFFVELWKTCSFYDNFLVKREFSSSKMKEYVCDKEEIKNCILNGINLQINDGNYDFSETLFFYPITYYLYHLSKMIVSGDVEKLTK